MVIGIGAQLEATVISGTSRVGASIPRLNSRSDPGSSVANISMRFEAMVISWNGRPDLAVADEETGGAAAVIAGDRIDPVADQLRDEQGFGESGEQVPTAARSGLEVEIARRGAGRAAGSACCMAGGRNAELARRSAFGDPGLKHSVGDNS
jgi:hypothetical protein